MKKTNNLEVGLGKLQIDGFTFDMGPSWYWMPDVFEKFFAKHGKTTSSYYNLKKLDPGFTVFYGKDDTFSAPASFDELADKFEYIEPQRAKIKEIYIKC